LKKGTVSGLPEVSALINGTALELELSITRRGVGRGGRKVFALLALTLRAFQLER
jgi:hypothetical protein